jgi:hypothetical protein
MALINASVSVAAGKAQIRHNGKWVLLDPDRSWGPPNFTVGIKIKKTGNINVTCGKYVCSCVGKYEDFAWDDRTSCYH